MKKIILILTLLLTSFLSFAQEGFEGSATTLPAGWNIYQNAVGANVWSITNSSALVCFGSNAVQINRENLGFTGTPLTSEDYLVTPSYNVPVNGQFRFVSRQGTLGDQGGKYQLKISTNPDKSILSAYVLLKEWTENEMNTVSNVCQEQKFSIPATYTGQPVFLALVRVVTQTSTAIVGDRWVVDNINLVSECLPPTAVNSTNIAATSATLNWTNPSGGPQWGIAYAANGGDFASATQITVAAPAVTTVGGVRSYVLNPLIPGTPYQFWVRSMCTLTNTSDWIGPFNFQTLALGTVCADPIVVVSPLPYQNNNNTGNFSDLIDTLQSNSPLCGATPATTNFMAGNDVFYRYTATASGLISIRLTPAGPNASVFVYPSCPITGACLGGVANTGSGVRLINNFAVTAGTSYTIVVSSALPTQTVGYTLIIQQENCTAPVGNIPTNITTTSADLSWSNPTGASSWQVALQTLGTGIPTTAGTTVASNTLYQPVLTAATQYEYWVRSECAPGVFSSWAGPYVFNTLICNPADKCNHTFRMFSAATGGFNGARMEVRQSGILVATIGSTYTSNTFNDVVVPLCPNQPFELFWTVAGTQPLNCGVSVINFFGQTIFTKPAGVSSAGQQVYSAVVNCLTPVCNIAPITTVANSITINSAVLNWTSPATTNFDIFIVPFGNPAPTATTVPTYSNVALTAPFSFATTLPLLADTRYTYYIRVVCAPNPSPWSNGTSFTTLPTCSRPTNLGVTGITTTGATLSWSNGTPTDSSWEILLVPSPTYTLPLILPPVNPTVGGGTILISPITTASPYVVTGLLSAATIYFYYVRTVCSTSDKSTWAGPFAFNTVLCDPASTCTYPFILTDSGSNGWNSGRMEVRQNGIVVRVLGTTISGAGPITVNVPLCPGVPFDLFWVTAGTAPDEIGVQIRNPFTDILYTKAPGVGTPGTVLFSGTANCTAPTCPKPTALTATNISSTTAELNWTETGTATQWEVYAVPITGHTLPVNGSPVSVPPSVGPYYLVNSLPFTIQTLLPVTNYIYYVRAICSATNVSTWTILSPKTFTTVPLNDECSTALNLTVNPTRVCATSTPGNTLGASASAPVSLSGPGCGVSDDDVWFKFTATNPIHLININNILGIPATVTLNHTLFSGNCATLDATNDNFVINPGNATISVLANDIVNFTSLSANQVILTPLNVPTGLTINANGIISSLATITPGTYTIGYKICQINNPTSCDTATATINIAATAATIDAVDDIYTTTLNNVTPSVLINDVVNGVALLASQVVITTVNFPTGFTLNPNGSIGIAAGTAAGTYNLTYKICLVSSPTDCNEAAVTLNLSPNSSAMNALYCSTAVRSVAENLVVGNTYYIRVYTAGGIAGQSATFSVCVGTPPPPATNLTCATALDAAVNNKAKCTVITPGNVIGATGAFLPTDPIIGTPCVGDAQDDVWFKFNATKTKHYISLLNVEGTSTNMNLAVYSGTCTSLNLLICSPVNTLTVNSTFVVGQTYYVRIWSNSPSPQVTTFDLCIKSESTCEDAEPLCGSSVADPYIFENTTGIRPGAGQIACLFTTPNPVYFTIKVATTGPMFFNIVQNTVFTNGVATGQGLDVDFVCWGPFTTAAACSNLNASTVIDCSYSAAAIETLSIPNAQAGQYYILLVTNYRAPDLAGFISLVQTNFSTPGAGLAVCCRVDLGPDKIQCAASVELNALAGVIDLSNIPSSYEWFYNGSTTAIPGATSATYTATQSGSYKVKGICGINFLEDTISVTLGPVVNLQPLTDFSVCDSNPSTGFGNFDLTTMNAQVLGSLSPLAYDVTYHLTQVDATSGANPINTTLSFTNTIINEQIIFVRLKSATTPPTCFDTKPLKLKVTPIPVATFSYAAINYCDNQLINPTPIMVASATIGIFTASPAGLAVASLTGVINLASSTQGTYTVINTIAAASGCSEVVSSSVTVRIDKFRTATFSYANSSYCSDNIPISPIFTGTNQAGTFTSLPVGLSISPTTGMVNIAGSTPGVYVITNTISASNACQADTKTFTITITRKPTGTITYPSVICKSDSMIQNVTSTVTPGGIYSSTTGLSLNASTGAITPSTSTPGTYVVTYTIAANGGCALFTTTSGNILVVDVWDFTISSPTTSICATQSVLLSFTANNFVITNPAAIYTWRAPNGTTTIGTTLNANQVGVYSLEVNILGCKTTKTITLTSNTTPIPIEFKSGCEGNAFKIEANPINNSFDSATSTFIWTGPVPNSFTTIPGSTNKIIAKVSGNYTIKVTTADGCSSTQPINILSVSCLIQQGISPNNDNINDNFDLSTLAVEELEIFNRYGTKVYNLANYTNQWIGQTNSGDTLPDGTYFYIIKKKDGNNLTGWIYINK